MTELVNRRCVPCERGTLPMTDDQVASMLPEVAGWDLDRGQLMRDVKVKNFPEALALVNRVGEVAEAENHHPNLCIHSWNHVRMELSTHSIGGLSENDFILAAKINSVLSSTGFE